MWGAADVNVGGSQCECESAADVDVRNSRSECGD